MPTEVEGTHEIAGVSLYTKTWLPDGPPVAKLVFIHGFNDHVGRYYDLFPNLASRSIAVYAYDQRGWGRSVKTAADKGKTGPTTLVISDMVDFIKSLLPSDVPIFVMGHSMGGGQALTLASDPQYEETIKQVTGWILESPFIGFPKGFEPNPVEVFLGKLAAKVLPSMQRFSALPAETLTRDPEVLKSLKEDKLLHGSATLEGLSGMLTRTSALGNGTVKINPNVNRLWLGHGTADKGTGYEASKTWFERQVEMPNWTFKTYEGWGHQLHADTPETTPIFVKDVGDWILAQLADLKAGESKL